mmetsp:Transcript_42296/g.95665  ORF Transcript_42296/g.95665 Transcript_42296/m.95665 type:complete len:81 (-) Transcript_42296:11-253(-)
MGPASHSEEGRVSGGGRVAPLQPGSVAAIIREALTKADGTQTQGGLRAGSTLEEGLTDDQLVASVLAQRPWMARREVFPK